MGELLKRKASFDPWLLLSIVSLLSLGLVMVVSSSLSYSESLGKPSWYFAVRHLSYLGAGVVGGMLATTIKLSTWRRISLPLLGIVIVFLTLLLLPGVSRKVNGSVRWLFLGPISIQVSEFAKLGLILYMSSYLVRKEKEVHTEISGFLKPLAILGVVATLILLEPDFGATVVLVSTVMGMLFLGGVPLKRFAVLVALAVGALMTLSIASPYRLQRLTSFLDPWSDQFNSGYQLTQSLIAFGRGGWGGAGLGNSVQKLLYLPESHTDFIYAVAAEELGLIGAIVILMLFALFVWRTLAVGRHAMITGHRFGGFIAYGIGLWFGIQTLINVGVNVGVLPTKGLTLPFMSYGGSSLVVSLVAIGILLRVEYESAMGHKARPNTF